MEEIARSSVVVEQRLRSLSADLRARVGIGIGIGIDGDERSVLVLARRLTHDGQHHLVDLDRLDATLLGP